MLEANPTNSLENTGLRTRVTVYPAVEPVTIAQVKSWGKIDFNDENDIIYALIESNRIKAELYTGRKFITQTIEAEWQTYSQKVSLPYPPHQEITEVLQIIDNVETELVEGTDYYITGLDNLVLEFTSPTSNAGLRVTYNVGYGLAADVPQAIKVAILKGVLLDYDYRSNIEEKNVYELPNSAKFDLQQYRILSL